MAAHEQTSSVSPSGATGSKGFSELRDIAGARAGGPA